MSRVIIKIAKIKINYTRFLNPRLAAFVNAVILAITGNVNFPLTQALLPDLADLLTSFNTAMANAENRDKVLIGLRDTAREALLLQVNAVAASVTFEAAGDRDKLLSSGFELYKRTGDGPPPVLGAITGFKVMDSDVPVGLKLVCDGVKNRKSYTHQITPDPLTPTSVWQSFTTTSKEYTFANLPSSKKFWCRILAIGTKGQVSISDPLSRVTQ
jgi:hypothetical protein